MNPHVYKSSPTFTLDLEDFEAYKQVIERSIKGGRMDLMVSGRTLLWVEEQIKLLTPKEKEKKVGKV